MLIFVSIAVLLVGAEAKFYTDCGSQLATVSYVRVTGCSQDAKECILRRNSNVTMNIEFTPNKELSSITTDIHGVMMNMPIPFPLADKDACKDKGLACPIQPNVLANYTATMAVLKAYPKVSVDVKWELKDENNVDIVCILVPSRIN